VIIGWNGISTISLSLSLDLSFIEVSGKNDNKSLEGLSVEID